MNPLRRELGGLSKSVKPGSVSADALVAVSAALLAACGALDAKPLAYSASILVESDPGTPVAGAEVAREGAQVAKTDVHGRASFRLEGLEGEAISVMVRCPDEYTSPATPTRVLLRRNKDSSRIPVYRATCAPKTRAVVVAVRANNGPNLPVVYLGKEVARTDESGVAHAGLRLRPGERIELTLSTEDNPRIVPQNPTAVFFAKDRDDLLFFDQSFKTVATRQGPRRRPEPLR